MRGLKRPRALEVIVTADDLGICAARNRGIAEAARAGAVSAASLLANGPAVRGAVRTFVADGNAALLGVHLNFTQGRALSPAERIPTLLGDGALFLGAAGFREAWARGAIDPAELIEEAAAQLSWFRSEVGRPPTHADGHQHVHVLPGCAELLGPVLLAAGVRHTRIPYEALPSTAAPACPTCAAALAHAAAARLPYAVAGVVAPQHFVGLSFCGVPYGPEDLLGAVRRVQRSDAAREVDPATHASGTGREEDAATAKTARLAPPRVVEIMTHPGALLGVAAAGDRGGGGGGWGWGDDGGFSSAPERWQELQTLCSPAWRDALRLGRAGEVADDSSAAAVEAAGELRLVGYEDSAGMAHLREATGELCGADEGLQTGRGEAAAAGGPRECVIQCQSAV